MYNVALFLHVISAFIIGYTTLYGSFNGVSQTSSKQLRINLLLLSSMSVVSLLTATWIIYLVNYSHSSLWVSISYALWIVLVLINEGFVRRKQIKAKKTDTKEIIVTMEYRIMTLIVVALTFLMIYKPS
ncbi:MAG: hypothetical protein VX359_04695 [Chloroflexota bacterium]